MKTIKNKRLRIGIVLFFTGILFLTTSLSVFAEDKKEETEVKEQGSITITLKDGKLGTQKDGIVFHCGKVADVINGNYLLTSDYENSGVNFSEVKTADDLETAAKKLEKVKTSDYEEKATDSMGKVAFEKLDIGVYLISVIDTEHYDTITPFIVGIPTFDDVTGEMVYAINAIPKHEPKSDPEKPGKPEKPKKEETQKPGESEKPKLETTERSNQKSPQTGIENRTMLFVIFACISGLGVLISFVISRKISKKNHDEEDD